MHLGKLIVTASLLATPLVAIAGPQVSAAPAAHAPAERPRAVIGSKVIGHSVRGRPIRAWHLGQSGGKKILLISTMHGNEGRTRQILASLRDGRAFRGVNLWVVPVYNPDGLARGTRKNAHGVDLNRNFPYRWADLDGNYESGPRPGSEPETRAMMRFLRRLRPSRIVSFHQPLHGVDTDTKSKAFARRLAHHLQLPRKALTCSGVCHGTMTGWYNHHFAGSAVTVEYGARPSHRRMTVDAPRQLLRLFGARWVRR